MTRALSLLLLPLVLASCASGTGPHAEGMLGALSGRDAKPANNPTHDVRHVRPLEESRGQLRWGLEF